MNARAWPVGLFSVAFSLCAPTALAQPTPAPSTAPDDGTVTTVTQPASASAEAATVPTTESTAPPAAATDDAATIADNAATTSAPVAPATAPTQTAVPVQTEPTAPPAQAPAASTASTTAAAGAEAAKDGEATQWLADHFFGHIKVRGYTQFRFNGPTSNDKLVNLQGDKTMGGNSQFSIRRARLILSGDIHPLVSIYLQSDFASATESGLHFVQMRDWYADIAAPGKEFRLRVGQSKVPYGFENMQSSSNRLPPDRSDAINSALANERDLGVFFYWAPAHIRDRFSALVKDNLKGSGDYGVVALGVYNGQTANKADLNGNKHVVARVTYPFQIGRQYLEVGGGGYYGKFVIKKDEGIEGATQFNDARGHVAFVLYPQPFGIQAEYNMGIGPELTNVVTDTSAEETTYTGEVREKFLYGGYVLLSYKIEQKYLGTIIPYVRAMMYDGGKKHETNAPSYKIREAEVGVEWQPIGAIEFVSAFAAAERTAATLPYEQERGVLGRFQLQINY